MEFSMELILMTTMMALPIAMNVEDARELEQRLKLLHQLL